PDWETLSPEQKKLYARMMEVFAGFLTHTDYHIGRMLDYLKSIGEFDNTLILVISDNGASAEGGPGGTTNEIQFFNNAQETLEESLAKLDKLGGPETFNHYAWGWTWAGNTPFRRWKRETYRGGTSDPFIVHWPSGIKAKGEIRTQYAHAIDMVPTLLEILSIEPPQTIKGVTQSPIEGVSFAHSFDDADAPTRHHTQYFEMFGHRSLYHDGWRAVCPWPGPSFTEAGKGFGAPISAETLAELDAKGWELYHVAEDIAENHNVAADNREKVINMIATWYVEAGKYKVLPIDGSAVQRLLNERPQLTKDRISYTYFQDTQTVPWFGAVHVLNRPHSITADVEIPRGGAQGVLICQGTGAGGFAFYVKDGKLRYAHNYVSRAIFSVASQETVPEGRHQLRFEFEPTGKPDIPHGHGTPGRGQLYIDGRLVGDADIPYTTPVIFNPGGLTCGSNPGLPVTPEYASPFKFTGKIYGVTVDVSGDLIKDSEAEMRLVMARQ
ncbi:MAG TPA: sulfatase-like hydrolase/transferase, partial [Chloroflexota bacterium]|nr:sulfatase-like hydrolase/transferase [Chloroflexota bacterium]